MNPARKASYAFIAVVLFGVAIVGAVDSMQPPPATAPVQTSPQPCAQPFPSPTTKVTTLSNGTEITQTGYPSLVMSSASTMSVCVDYIGGSYLGPAGGLISTWNLTGGSRTAQNVNISASPAELFLAQGEGVVVEYIVEAGQDSNGFYGLSLLGGMCIPTPIAVGYQPSQVNSTDYPGLFDTVGGCPAGVLDGHIIGYTGAKIAYLTSESSFNPEINITDVSVSSFPTPQGAENVTFRMNIQSFSRPLTAGLSLSESIVRVFGSNPDLTTLPVNDYCSWYANHLGSMTITAFQDQPAGFMQIDAPVLQLGTYSNSTYSISILISGPIAKYTAIDPTLSAGVPGSPSELYSIAAFFPVSVSGQLQSISGECQGSSSG
jgi:hypothetical protein